MDIKRFTLTKDHIKLLRRMCVGWQEYGDGDNEGAPEIDPKRPYGNSDIWNDIHEILTGDPIGTTDSEREELEEEEIEKYSKIHREMETALQIVLSTGKFKPGIYECEEYSDDWKEVKK